MEFSQGEGLSFRTCEMLLSTQDIWVDLEKNGPTRDKCHSGVMPEGHVKTLGTFISGVPQG